MKQQAQSGISCSINKAGGITTTASDGLNEHGRGGISARADEAIAGGDVDGVAVTA